LKKIKLGSLDPTRDFVYVKDIVEGFFEIARSSKTRGEEINIATQSEISIGDLAQKIIEIINMDAEIIKDNKRVRPENSEVERLMGSSEKLKKLTAWNQKYSIEDGLKETIDWFSKKENLKQYKAGIYNV
jgi:dTDP-glucose 4,6-dehydratase